MKQARAWFGGVEVGRSQGSPREEQTDPPVLTPSARLVHALVRRTPYVLPVALTSPSATGRPGAERARDGSAPDAAPSRPRGGAAGRHQGGRRGPPMVGGRLAAGTTARHQAAGRQGRPSPRGGDAAEHHPDASLPSPTGTKFQSTDQEGILRPFEVGVSGASSCPSVFAPPGPRGWAPKTGARPMRRRAGRGAAGPQAAGAGAGGRRRGRRQGGARPGMAAGRGSLRGGRGQQIDGLASPPPLNFLLLRILLHLGLPHEPPRAGRARDPC